MYLLAADRMSEVLAAAAVIGTLAALATVALTLRSIDKLNGTLEKMDEQLKAAREGQEADERVARIEAMERAGDALARVAEVARAVAQRSSTEAALENEPLLRLERARLAAAVSAVLALHGRHLASSYRVATTEFTNVGALSSAAIDAMPEIGSALEDEVQATRL